MIITSELVDPEEASMVLEDPEVYERIRDDRGPMDPDDMEWPRDATYLGGFLGSELVAVSITHKTPRGDKFHFQVLKPYRAYKRELLRQALEYYSHLDLWCEIPDLYPEVYRLAREFGFREIEVLNDHYVKNGQRYDSRILEL